YGGDTDVPREPRVGVGRVGARLLVAHVHDRDALVEATLVDREDVPAAEREEMSRAGLRDGPRDEGPAGRIGPRSMGGDMRAGGRVEFRRLATSAPPARGCGRPRA